MQPTPSSQLGAVPAWQPSTALQVSEPSQNRPLSHRLLSGPLSQESVPSLQESTVQLTPSSQLGAVPAWQDPALQVSVPSQNRPLLQSASTVHSGPPPPTANTRSSASS